MARSERQVHMRLGAILRKWRYANERSLRDLGREIGISAATLLRIESGRECDSTTLMKIFNWMVADASR